MICPPQHLMRTILIFLLCASTAYATENFDSRGVWHPVSSVTLASGASVSFGIIDVTDREAELALGIYGTTPDDSLNVTVSILGMMSPNLADTAKSVTVYSGTTLTGGGMVVLPDTLVGDEMVPYMYGTITNADADSTLSGLDVWLYMIPRELTLIRER